MILTMRNLEIFKSLTIVRLRGFEPAKQWAIVDGRYVNTASDAIDPPGSANWLIYEYGIQPCEDLDPRNDGILWTDYDSANLWDFAVLIASENVESFRTIAVEAEYVICKVEMIAEPIVFGDGAGTVVVLKHPEGWVIIQS